MKHIAPAALWLAVLPVLAAIAGFGGVYIPVWVPIALILFFCACALLWVLAIGNHPFPWHPIMFPMAAFGALVLCQWCFHLSVYPGETLTELIQLAACGAVFYLAYYAAGAATEAEKFGWIVWTFTALLSTEAIAQAFTANNRIYWISDKAYASPVGPYVYHNHFAGCMELLLPVTIAVAFRPNRTADPAWVTWARRGIVPALGFSAVVISASRGGTLALGFELIVFGSLFGREILAQRATRNLAFAAIGSIVAFSLLGSWGLIVTRWQHFASHGAGGFWTRWRVTEACFRIWKQFPIFGSGFNTFSTVYPSRQAFDTGRTWLNAHDDFAQALAETGAIGAVCVLSFLFFWARGFWRRKGHTRGLAHSLQCGAFVGMAGFLFHSVGDFEFHAPANALLFFLMAGFALAPARRARKHSRRLHRVSPGVTSPAAAQ